MHFLKFIILFILVFCCINIYPSDTLVIDKKRESYNVTSFASIYKDTSNILTIDSILNKNKDYPFINIEQSNLNLSFSNSTYWFKFFIKNKSDKAVNYIFNVANPDIDYLNFYELKGDSITQSVQTGEFYDITSRDILNRSFLFRIFIPTKTTYTYYLSVNISGHPLYLPLKLYENEYFHSKEFKDNIFYWFIYGFLIFIFIFNLYLFKAIKDKVSLYYALYVFFAFLYFIHFDGYLFLLNPPIFLAKIKWISPSLYLIFLILFTKAFTAYNKKFLWIKKILNPFLYIGIPVSFFYFFRYPISLVPDIILPIAIIITLFLIIIIAWASLVKNYTPSYLLLAAYPFMFTAMIISQLKEFEVLPSNFFTDNVIKFGLSIECIILTIAVLERFRFNQEQAKKTIESSYNKIEIQNKELEIINAELEKLSIVASETNNSVTIYDENGKIEWCNTYFEKFYKTTLNDLIRSGKDYIENIIPNKNIHRLVKQCLSRKTLVTFETQIRTDGMEEIWVQTTLSPLTRRDVVYKLIAIDSDITELKQYEKNLELAKEKAVESDNLKTVFLGNMSHEIRTPLNGIMGFSDLLYNTEVDKVKRQKYLKMITTNGEQLLRIIDDIVDISLIESNQLRIDPTPLDLDQFLKGIIEFFEAYKQNISKSTIALRLENHINPIQRTIIADPIRLKQVLNNLINNGLKFTHEGYVRLACYKVDQKIQFCVEDTGIGLDPSKKEIIFERFRQVDERLNREYGGTGLGLSISKGIIEKMNGKIWVDSKEGKGLKICFHIPYVPFKKLKTVPSKTKIV